MDPHYWGAAWALLTMLVVSQGQTEEDEKRPYKFAFAIEGYQHRSEEKDERGIIMGEFGFVTGDGVYHLTVYATDENGNFKILKMKNFYIGLPGEGTTVAPSRAPVPPTRPTTPAPPVTTKSPILQHLEGLMGCSGCIVPNKNKNGKPGSSGGPPSSYHHGEGVIDERLGSSPGKPVKPESSTGIPGKPSYGGQLPGGKQPVGFTGGPVGVAGPISGVSGVQRPPSGGKTGGTPLNSIPSRGQPGQTLQSPGPSSSQVPGGFSQPPTSSGGKPLGSGGNRFGGTPSTVQLPGTSQSQAPGEGSLSSPVQTSGLGSPQFSDKLPPGMTMDDLMALLYKFNYTLKYHGHHEMGYRNGDKEGGYFFNGKDGLGRNVKYLANEFGFQPNITLVDLGLNSPDTPKEENEEPNELKGYEFKWFYKR